jgi:AcrR family transcriptional regulator
MAKTGTDAHRETILKAALLLLTHEGRDGITTRHVAEAAKVQPPVLYRIFGDKRGLLDAIAVYGFTSYLSKKHPPLATSDPVEALRAGWDVHVEFGLLHPALYLLMYADPRPGAESVAAQQSFAMLDEHMQHVAAAGRLRTSVSRACALYHAAAVGITMSLLATTPEQRVPGLATIAREHALAAITTAAPAASDSDIPATASQLRALLLREKGREENRLSEGESLLLSEWLSRLAE